MDADDLEEDAISIDRPPTPRPRRVEELRAEAEAAEFVETATKEPDLCLTREELIEMCPTWSRFTVKQFLENEANDFDKETVLERFTVGYQNDTPFCVMLMSCRPSRKKYEMQSVYHAPSSKFVVPLMMVHVECEDVQWVFQIARAEDPTLKVDAEEITAYLPSPRAERRRSILRAGVIEGRSELDEIRIGPLDVVMPKTANEYAKDHFDLLEPSLMKTLIADREYPWQL